MQKEMERRYRVKVHCSWEYVVQIPDSVVNVRDAVVIAAENAIFYSIKRSYPFGKNVGEVGSETLKEIDLRDMKDGDILIDDEGLFL